MTAYRQRAIAYAEALRNGPLRPRDLKHLADDAGDILHRNVYGPFDRVNTVGMQSAQQPDYLPVQT